MKYFTINSHLVLPIVFLFAGISVADDGDMPIHSDGPCHKDFSGNLDDGAHQNRNDSDSVNASVSSSSSSSESDVRQSTNTSDLESFSPDGGSDDGIF